MAAPTDEFSALAELQEMWDEMALAPAIVQASDFWRLLNDRNVRQLDDMGFAHFKRTINQNYFGWIPCSLRDDQLLAMVISWLRHPVAAVASVKLGDVATFEAGP